MKSFSRVCLILLFLIACGIGLERLHHFLTDGFTLERTRADQYYLDTSITPSPSVEELALICGMLDQKFIYLGKGTQSFAFESHDQKYVLKLYKHHRHRRGLWMQPFSAFPFNRSWSEKRLDQTRHFQEAFYSFKLAIDALRQETGLVYAHLGKTDFLHQRILIADKMGREHSLDLDRTDFVLQKKARLIRPLIEELMGRGDTEGAKKALTLVIDLLKRRCEKGIGDRDPGITYNLGLVDDEAIFIDLGQFYLAPELKNRTAARLKIFDITGTLRDWLKIYYPDLESHVLQEVDRI